MALAVCSASRISAQPSLRKFPIVASLLTAAALGALAWRFGERLDLLPFSVLAVVGVALALIDLIEHKLAAMRELAARHDVTHLGMPDVHSTTGRRAIQDAS